MHANTMQWIIGTVLLAGPVGTRAQGTDAVEPGTQQFELTLAGGYAQAWGDVGRDLPAIDDTAGAGGRLIVGVGYRLTPNLTLGAYVSSGRYALGSATPGGSKVWDATAGIQASWRFLPHQRIDPWLSLGTGWHGYLIELPDGRDTRQGLELARVQVGADWQLTPQIAIGPVVGGSLDLFLSRSAPKAGSYSEIASKSADFTLFTGLQARFDL